jgi:hypothetical protein
MGIYRITYFRLNSTFSQQTKPSESSIVIQEENMKRTHPSSSQKEIPGLSAKSLAADLAKHKMFCGYQTKVISLRFSTSRERNFADFLMQVSFPSLIT